MATSKLYQIPLASGEQLIFCNLNFNQLLIFTSGASGGAPHDISRPECRPHMHPMLLDVRGSRARV
jgi:hypothetical protein